MNPQDYTALARLLSMGFDVAMGYTPATGLFDVQVFDASGACVYTGSHRDDLRAVYAAYTYATD